MVAFNEHLRKIRKSKKRTQKETAVAVGTNERNYQDWEYGKNKPGFESLIPLADFFGVSLDYLVGRIEDDTIENSARNDDESRLLNAYRKLDGNHRQMLINMAAFLDNQQTAVLRN